MYEYRKKLFCFFVLLVIDQVSKYIIRSNGGFYICNKNFAFGLSPLIFFLILLSFILFFLVFNFKFKILNLKLISNFNFQISNFALAEFFSIILIISGAISNIIDRLYFGCVIDFIDLRFWPVFNLADIYITIGAIILIIRTTDYH